MELTNQEKSLLSFQVGPFRICVQATEAESILELPEIHSIPLTPPSIAGMFLYRERVATAVDVARKLGLSHETEAVRGQLIIVPLGEDIYGFLVDTVHELIPTEKIHWNSMRGIAKIEAFEHFGVLDDEIILFTSFRDVLDMKEIPLDDESLRTFIKSNSARSDVKISHSDNRHQPLTDESTVSPEREDPEVKAEEETGFSPEESSADEKINEEEQVSDNVPDTAEKVNEPESDVPEDAVSREEIAAFKNQVKKADTGQAKPAPKQRKPAKQQRRSQPTQKQHHRRQKQAAPGTYQQSQARPVQRTYVEEPSFADRFTKKSLAIAAAIIIFLSAAIFILRNGGEETTEGVNVASVSSESPRREAAPRETAQVPDDREESEPVPAGIQSTQESTSPVSGSDTGPAESNEILRVDTDEFTLTVERGNRSESPPADDNENSGTTSRPDNANSYQVAPPSEREYDFNSTVNTEIVQKQPVSEPQPVTTETAPSVPAPSKPAANQPPDVEYVHVVKQGDTLWDISRQYLGNPLHYPELARLSQISDPDWIFPGDVVRIRRK